MKTIKLQTDRTHHNTPLLIFLGVVLLLFVVNALEGQQAHVDTVRPTPALIYILSTPVPTVQPTADTQVQETIARLERRVAELEAERSAAAPEPVYQELTVQQAAPTMPPQPTPGPQLQAVTLSEGEEPLTDAQMREAMDQ